MKVLVLGPIELHDGHTDQPMTYQAKRLLGVLVARCGQATSALRIADELGMDADRHRVRMAVSRLRQRVGDRIVSSDVGYRFVPGAGDSIDAARFEALVGAAAAQPPGTPDRVRLLREALGLWRGPAFDGLDDVPAIGAAITRLEELRATATEDLAEAMIDAGLAEEAILLIEARPATVQYRERPVALLMRALASSGRLTEALRAYQRFRIELRDEIGVLPSPALREFEAGLLTAQVQSRDPEHADRFGTDDNPSSRSSNPPATNLPVRPTSLIGRDRDIAGVLTLLEQHRCVTLTAVGGAGKTRLAIAVGEAELARRSGGVWFANLTAVTTDAAVPAAIAQAVGLTLRGGDATSQVIDHLADKPALVIVDNCEHVIDGCAALVHRFLTSSGRAALLTTSREPLNVEGERVMPLACLSTDGQNSPAARLFNERATAAGALVPSDDDTASTITTICRRLDGIPLAIELAATRMTMMTASELEAALDDRFVHLTRTRQRHGPRRTLTETLDWSFDLLTEREQLVLTSLGMFVDTFDIDAVTAVSGVARPSAFAAMDALTSKSLALRADDAHHGRFRLLETVKAYALGRLADADATRERHLQYFHARATAPAHSGIADVRHGLALRSERGNLTAAFTTATSTGRAAVAGELIAGCYPAYIFDGAGLAAREMIAAALADPGVHQTPVADQLHVALVMTAAWLTDWDGYAHGGRELTRSPNMAMRALGEIALAITTPFAEVGARAQMDRAKRALTAALAGPDEVHPVIPPLMSWLEGRLAVGRGDFEAGLRGCLAFLAACRELDYYPTPIPRAAKLAATCQLLLGDPTSATATAQWLQDFEPTTFNIDDIRALALVAQGRLSEAEPLVRSHALQGLSGRMPGRVCDSVLILASLANAEGNDVLARDLLLQMGAGLEPGMIAYSRHLAAHLDISSEHAQRQQQALTFTTHDPEGVNGARLAARAVRAELARRGWE